MGGLWILCLASTLFGLAGLLDQNWLVKFIEFTRLDGFFYEVTGQVGKLDSHEGGIKLLEQPLLASFVFVLLYSMFLALFDPCISYVNYSYLL